MQNKNPKIIYLNKIHSNVHFCREAMLVRLNHGTNYIRCVREENREESYTVMMGSQPMTSMNIPNCGTCADMIRQADNNITIEECIKIRDRINDSYRNLQDAIKNMEPLFGLLKSGDYIVADFDLFPVIGREHFWNAAYYEKSLLRYGYFWPKGESLLFDAPAAIFPSEPAARFDRERVDYYRNRFDEGNHFPRSIAYYLNGCMTLLLDGHHKAAAAAAEGKLAPCLVIMPVNLHVAVGDDELLFLTHNKGDYVNVRSNADTLLLCNRQEQIIGQVSTMEERALDAVNVEHIGRDNSREWGAVPEEYCKNLDKYRFYTAMRATIIPPNQVKEMFDKFRRREGTFEELELLQKHLLYYCSIFPDNKWIPQNQQEWLEDTNLVSEMLGFKDIKYKEV